MATKHNPITCHHCGAEIKVVAGEYHIIGIDISEMPPASVYACGTCWRANPTILGAAPAPEPMQMDLGV